MAVRTKPRCAHDVVGRRAPQQLQEHRRQDDHHHTYEVGYITTTAPASCSTSNADITLSTPGTVTCQAADHGAEAIAELARSGVRIAAFSLGQPSLDEVFLALTGHPAEALPPEQPTSIEDERVV